MTEAALEAIGRLASARGGEDAFLKSHHVEAARRLARLFERAQMRQRVTMSYDPARLGGRGGGNAQAEMSVSAAEARQKLAALAAAMPGECWSVLFDTCGLERGLQDIETAQGWPRRSGKLVLRIALSHLADRFGLTDSAVGAEAGRQRGWLEQRPAMFGPEAAS